MTCPLMFSVFVEEYATAFTCCKCRFTQWVEGEGRRVVCLRRTQAFFFIFHGLTCDCWTVVFDFSDLFFIDQNQGECCHSVEERAFTGVYCTRELHRAVTESRTMRLRSFYNFNEHSSEKERRFSNFVQTIEVERKPFILLMWSGIKYDYWQGNNEEGKGGLFTSYVNNNMMEKIYAPGFPSDVKTDAEKKEFIRDYEEKEEIKLDQSKFMKDPGKRAVAKLMLNSLWWKFAQRADRLQNEIIQFFRILHDTALEVLDVRPVNDTLIVQYRTRAETQLSLQTSAYHIAALTTAYGRLELHDLMKKGEAEILIHSGK
ncbi:unnamed protein product [Caenorhabditis brenneri]